MAELIRLMNVGGGEAVNDVLGGEERRGQDRLTSLKIRKVRYEGLRLAVSALLQHFPESWSVAPEGRCV